MKTDESVEVHAAFDHAFALRLGDCASRFLMRQPQHRIGAVFRLRAEGKHVGHCEIGVHKALHAGTIWIERSKRSCLGSFRNRSPTIAWLLITVVTGLPGGADRRGLIVRVR